MRNVVVAGLIVIFVFLGAGVGYFLGVNSATTVNGAGMKSLETVSTCTISDPSKGISIRVTDGTRPIGGASISVQDISACSDTNPRVAAQYVVATNSTGYANACSEYDGTCNFSVHYSGENYSASIPLSPGILSYVYYDLSTGNVTVTTHYARR